MKYINAGLNMNYIRNPGYELFEKYLKKLQGR